ncbi:hypothetical protein CDL12_20444 [Handroanthus impetiginosus]|uniref:TF-B3 domain-containing protein n=1 Tax=Handroanthus impetiginosus TaxID=429701 RepID=A0A2G9GNW7_9LAMI|nr:hypothetical protein CDL12_20444 [Handroanthus impetiginosus]
MVRDSKTGSSFYKFLMDDDFTSKLRIPTQFMKNYEDKLPSNITLRTHDLWGKSKSWRVQIEQVKHHHFFTEGWSKFAQDVDLKLREFLLFKFVGSSAFHVSVYDIAGCKKEFSYSGDQERKTSAVKRWEFSKELKMYHFADCRLSIPKCFAKGTGLHSVVK